MLARSGGQNGAHTRARGKFSGRRVDCPFVGTRYAPLGNWKPLLENETSLPTSWSAAIIHVRLSFHCVPVVWLLVFRATLLKMSFHAFSRFSLLSHFLLSFLSFRLFPSMRAFVPASFSDFFLVLLPFSFFFFFFHSFSISPDHRQF